MIQVLSYFAFAVVTAFASLGVFCGAMMLMHKARVSALVHLPRNILAALLVCALVATDWAQKSGVGLAPRMSGASSPSMPASETEGTGPGPMTNISFTAICVNSNSVFLSLAWPIGCLTEGDRLEVFSTPSLSDPADLSTDDGSSELNWRWCAGHTIVSGSTNVTLSIAMTGDAGLPPAQFYKAVAHLLPFVPDIDGDGLADSVDPEPLVAGADARGTNAEWYDVVCSNVFTKAGEGVPVGRAIVLPNGETVYFREDVNADAYYFVEVVAAQGPTAISFNADQPGRLGCPSVIARTGETNLVPLLMGVEYMVTSAVPISVQAPQALYANITTNNPMNYSVRWPLDFVAVEDSPGVHVVDVRPYDPGGTFTWSRGVVGARHAASRLAAMARLDVGEQGCPYTVMGSSVEFGCNGSDNCGCGGCTVYATYGLEGTAFYGGSVACGCDDDDDDEHHEDPGPQEPLYISPQVIAYFTSSAVIFEDEYQNEVGGAVIPHRSTETMLVISAAAGSENATLSFTTENLGKLNALDGQGIDLPASIELGAWGSYSATFVCEGIEASDYEGDVALDVYIENDSGDSDECCDEITVVKVELTPEDVPPQNPSLHRHVMGVCEKVDFRAYPSSAVVRWDINPISSAVINSDATAFFCQRTGGNHRISVLYGGEHFDLNYSVIEPTVECRGVTWNDTIVGVTGQAGWLGMKLDLYLQPQTVSFEWVQLAEIPVPPEDAIPAFGYFNLMPDVLPPTHDENAGAGVWIQPHLNDGSWACDKAQMPCSCPALPNSGGTLWTEGVMTWAIPVGWGDGNEVFGYITPNPTTQLFSIVPNGTVSIQKYGHIVQRSLLNLVWIDGARVR